MEGEYPKAASERLGHRRTGITMDLYTHAVPGTGKRLAGKVDEILSGKTLPAGTGN